MGVKHIALFLVLVAAVSAQESDSSPYIISRARRSPPYQYSPPVSNHGGAGRPYYNAHLTPHGYRPNRFDYQYNQGHQQLGYGNGNYYYNNGNPTINSFGTPSVFPLSHQDAPGTLMWVPLDTLPFHVMLQQQLEFMKLHSAISQPPIIGGEDVDAVEIPGQLYHARVYRQGVYSTTRRVPHRRPCLRRHIWTKEGDIMLPKSDSEMERASRNIPITFPSNLYRPPTVLREVRREPTVLKEIRRPAAVTLQEVENEVDNENKSGGH